jgi:hypothetical protein
MWRGFEMGLYQYAMVMVAEANRRGIKTENNVRNLEELNDRAYMDWGYGLPFWMDDKKIMAKVTTTHKANLYRKDSIYYADFVKAVVSKNNEPCCERCQYYWVTHNTKETV